MKLASYQVCRIGSMEAFEEPLQDLAFLFRPASQSA